MIPLTLNLLQGSVTFRFSPSAALDLQREINILLDRLKAIASNAASGGKPQPQNRWNISTLVMCFWKCFVIPIFIRILFRLKFC